jgi:hypothetical protein
MKRIVRLGSTLATAALIGACSPDATRATDTQHTSTSGGTAATGGTGGSPTAVDYDAARPGCTTIQDRSTGNIVIICPSSIAATSPFVRSVGVVTDSVTTAALDNPEPGRLCMSGRLANAGTNEVNWGAFLAMDFVVWNPDQTAILEWLDARALGITQLEFTLDSPPADIGVSVGLVMLTDMGCTTPGLCSKGGRFRLMTGDSPFAYLTRGAKGPLPLTAFIQPPWDTSTLALDPSKLYGLSFILGSNSGAAIDYDFCISNLKFLNANGDEVFDPQLADGGA